MSTILSDIARPTERRTDEMVLALCHFDQMDDEAACIVELLHQGFGCREIIDSLDEVRVLARLTTADGWVA